MSRRSARARTNRLMQPHCSAYNINALLSFSSLLCSLSAPPPPRSSSPLPSSLSAPHTAFYCRPYRVIATTIHTAHMRCSTSRRHLQSQSKSSNLKRLKLARRDEVLRSCRYIVVLRVFRQRGDFVRAPRCCASSRGHHRAEVEFVKASEGRNSDHHHSACSPHVAHS